MDNSLDEAMRGCGELLSGISDWFNQCLTFLQTDFLHSRNGIVPCFISEQNLISAPGRLHWKLSDPVLSNYGKYTVCADLVLHEPEINIDQLPFVVWQICASSEPKKKKLNFYPYHKYPHYDPEQWVKCFTGQQKHNLEPQKLYYKTEKSLAGTFNRNCVIYHTVTVLENERNNFFSVFVKMIQALQLSKFMAGNYSDKLSQWLSPPPSILSI